MFKRLFVLLSAIFLTFSALAEKHDTTKVGVILPLTGPLSAFGVAFQNGITLAQRTDGGALKGITFEY